MQPKRIYNNTEVSLGKPLEIISHTSCLYFLLELYWDSDYQSIHAYCKSCSVFPNVAPCITNGGRCFRFSRELQMGTCMTNGGLYHKWGMNVHFSQVLQMGTCLMNGGLYSKWGHIFSFIASITNGVV